jgi:hypothetical protein
VPGFQRSKAFGLQGTAYQLAQALLVVDYKNHSPGLGSGVRPRHSLAACGLIG